MSNNPTGANYEEDNRWGQICGRVCISLFVKSVDTTLIYYASWLGKVGRVKMMSNLNFVDLTLVCLTLVCPRVGCAWEVSTKERSYGTSDTYSLWNSMYI